MYTVFYRELMIHYIFRIQSQTDDITDDSGVTVVGVPPGVGSSSFLAAGGERATLDQHKFLVLAVRIHSIFGLLEIIVRFIIGIFHGIISLLGFPGVLRILVAIFNRDFGGLDIDSIHRLLVELCQKLLGGLVIPGILGGLVVTGIVGLSCILVIVIPCVLRLLVAIFQRLFGGLDIEGILRLLIAISYRGFSDLDIECILGGLVVTGIVGLSCILVIVIPCVLRLLVAIFHRLFGGLDIEGILRLLIAIFYRGGKLTSSECSFSVARASTGRIAPVGTPAKSRLYRLAIAQKALDRQIDWADCKRIISRVISGGGMLGDLAMHLRMNWGKNAHHKSGAVLSGSQQLTHHHRSVSESGRCVKTRYGYFILLLIRCDEGVLISIVANTVIGVLDIEGILRLLVAIFDGIFSLLGIPGIHRLLVEIFNGSSSGFDVKGILRLLVFIRGFSSLEGILRLLVEFFHRSNSLRGIPGIHRLLVEIFNGSSSGLDVKGILRLLVFLRYFSFLRIPGILRFLLEIFSEFFHGLGIPGILRLLVVI
uniref:Uncharacterized protein n=1 Tax=Pristionchus pacificus TaxID=54126 RepID=A0A2A6B5K9_PRIPA|eukprot:PDM61141.1 hypothetical protein PRIPAC_50583 [Pristionchus pacificus]